MMKTLRALTVLNGIVILTACSEGSPTGPSTIVPPPSAPQNLAPTFAQAAVVQSGYRAARLTTDVRDADGQVAKVVVNWGDGKEETITSAFGNISRTHEYAEAQAYSVALAATDNLGATAQSLRSVNITVPPEKCVGIRIIDVCGRVTSDFKRINLSVKAVDTVVHSMTISEGTPSLSITLFPSGRLTATFAFNTGRLRLQGDYCAVPLLVCTGVFDETIQF